MIFNRRSNQKTREGKALNDQGFTMMELIIVIALMALLIGVAAVGMNGYFQVADQMERSEIAETSFYSLQSYINYLERRGELEEFEKQVVVYNENVYGRANILSVDENRRIIELNYEGEDASSFYTNEYYPDHEDSEIIYITIDKNRADKESNPIYPVLAAALQNEEAMENSFLVEYDLSTGVVRSVFYSENADGLTFHFASDNDAVQNDYTDCILRDAGSLADKKQGYYGLTFTSAHYEENINLIMAPSEVTLVNGDRLYLTWVEENANNSDFMSGAYQLDELSYIVKLYDQNMQLVAMYDMSRAEMYQDTTGTEAGVLNYLDDFAQPVQDTLAGSTKTARIGYADLSYTESPDGVAAQRYYMLLECLDHPFLQNGYSFAPEDTLYATLEIVYGATGLPTGEFITSNTESAYFAHVENASGGQEFGIGCARHLWNIRHGLYNGAYRLVADVDWQNIEGRGRDITFTSTQFADKSVIGMYHSFEGTLTGEKPEDDGSLYSCYRVNGITISEEGNEQVGLFTINRGSIDNVILSDFFVKGSNEVGTLAGLNMGTVESVCVLNTAVSGEEKVGGLVGLNEGVIADCTVTTGDNRITGIRYLGGVVGYCKNEITDTRAAANVEAVIPESTDKITTNKLGFYIGGVIGYMEADTKVEKLSSGVAVDDATGMPLADNGIGVMLCGNITGIQSVGGVIGEVPTGTGTLSDLYNYANLHVTYINAEDRAARGETTVRIYQYYGGITGRVMAGNTLKNCENYASVALSFLKDGVEPDREELYSYQSAYPVNGLHWNMPRYIGGIAGHNAGTVEDCVTLCGDYGTFEEEAAAYDKVVAKEENGYVGCYVGGLVGYNEGTVLITKNLSSKQGKVDVMQVVVRAFGFSNGGLVGYSKTGSSILCEKNLLTIQGVVTAQGLVAPQAQQPYECVGGMTGYIASGVTLTGTYANECNVMGRNAGGIAGFVGVGLTLKDCTNAAVVYGKGMTQGMAGSIGGIAGRNYGTLIDCTNTGSVTADSALGDVVNDSTILAHTNYYGGVAGLNYGLLQNCHSKRNADKTNVIVGYNTNVVGGLVGYNSYDGKNYFGEIVHDGREEVDVPIIIGGRKNINAPTVGGIVGSAVGPLELKDFTYSSSILVKCAKTNNSSGGIGGIMGLMNKNQSLTGCIMSGQITSSSIQNGGLVGVMKGGVIDNTNQVLESVVIVGASYTGGVVGYYAVYASDTVSHVDIMHNAATVSGSVYTGGLAGYVVHASTFDMSNRSNSGYVSGTENVGGLAGYYYLNAEATALDGCVNTGQIIGKKHVGGLLGRVTSVAKHPGYQVTDCLNQGDVLANAGTQYFGGLIGKAEVGFDIRDCKNEGNLSAVENSGNAAYVGGIIGGVTTELFYMDNCVNTGDITASTWAGGFIGYIWVNGQGTAEITNCTNEAEVSMVSVAYGVGGIIGQATSNKSTNIGTININNCVNYSSIDTPQYAGGILGYSAFMVLNITECDNYGPIGMYSDGRWTMKLTGGIVGFANTAAATPESVIKDCTQNAGIYNIGQYGGPGSDCGTGGIVGRTKVPMVIENCFYGDGSTDYVMQAVDSGAGCVGGIAGSAWGNSLRLINCASYADIVGEGKLSYTGGLVGGVNLLSDTVGLQIGEKDNAATYCYFYGDIDAKGVLASSGGILGYAGRCPVWSIYGSINYGSIGKSATYVSASGGIVGNSLLNQDYKNDTYEMATMEDCTNLGNIYQAYSDVGGLLGANQYLNLVVDNCQNGSVTDADCGVIYGRVQSEVPRRVGGLIGSVYDAQSSNPYNRICVITGSNNYADMVFDHSKYLYQGEGIGGLIGMNRVNTTIGDKNDAALTCANYGNIRGTATSALYMVGGIIGHSQLGGEMHLYGIKNYGGLGEGFSYISSAGGIVGVSSGNGELVECQNLGTLVNMNGVAYNANGCGGIVGGVNRGSLVLEACVSGDKDDATLGTIEADSRVGGIIGLVYSSAGAEVLITNCTNYVDFICDKPVYYVGGIVAAQGAHSTLKIQNTVNYGNIIGIATDDTAVTVQRAGGFVGWGDGTKTSVLEIGGVNGDAADAALACTNYGEIRMENGAVGVWLGGFVGEVRNMKHVSVYGAINEADFVAEEDSVITCVGGIAGYVHTYGDNMFVDCKQNGSMSRAAYQHNGTNTDGGAAGIVARVYGDTTLIRCDNGSVEARAAGESDGQIQAVSWYSAANTKGPQYMAGIVGIAYNTLNMQECANYADISLDCTGAADNASGYNGGIVGYVVSVDRCDEEQKVLLSCVNYGDLRATGILYRTGGILGSSASVNDGKIRLGDGADASLQCINYGNLYFGGDDLSHRLGGLVGAAERGIYIYDGINYGDIGEDGSGMLAGAGGIVGVAGGSYYSGENHIEDCVQLGAIRQIYQQNFGSDGSPYNQSSLGTGGIAGTLCGPNVTIKNCVNGSASDPMQGSLTLLDGAAGVGGIVGHERRLASGDSFLLSCVNYADIISPGTLSSAGGLVGHAVNLKIGMDGNGSLACTNYGDVYGNGCETRIGGLAGWLGSDSAIYGGINEGEKVALGKDSGSFLGGIVGRTYGANIILKDIVNHADLLTEANVDAAFTFVGGIVGHSTAELIENCTNNGQIGYSAYANSAGAERSGQIGGIVGGMASASGSEQEIPKEVKNCTNLGTIYVGSVAVGGIVGQIDDGSGADTIITGCVNGKDGDALAGAILLQNREKSSYYIGGIVGYARRHNHYKEIYVTDCINYGDITLAATQSNSYVGGVMGTLYSSNGTMGLGIINCKNYGDLSNFYLATGGIYGANYSGGEFYNIAYCENHGNLVPGDMSLGAHISGNIGGITGSLSANSGMMHCINTGDVVSDHKYSGGLTGYLGKTGYMVDCYQLGNVSGTSARELAGAVSSDATGFLIDAYSINGGKELHPAVDAATIAGQHMFWQAQNAGGAAGYLDEAAYNTLCTAFGITPAWQAGDMLANARYLTANYTYAPSSPTAYEFAYVPADTAVEGSVPKLTWKNESLNYFAAAGTEIYLYDSSMADADILADTTGAAAFLAGTVSYRGGAITATGQIDITQLPAVETTFKVVIKTLGYTCDGMTITTDTQRAIQGTVTLPADPAASIMLFELSPEESGPETDVTDVDGDVSGGDLDVSGGDLPGGDVSGGDMPDDVADDVSAGNAA